MNQYLQRRYVIEVDMSVSHYMNELPRQEIANLVTTENSQQEDGQPVQQSVSQSVS